MSIKKENTDQKMETETDQSTPSLSPSGTHLDALLQHRDGGGVVEQRQPAVIHRTLLAAQGNRPPDRREGGGVANKWPDGKAGCRIATPDQQVQISARSELNGELLCI